MDDSLYFRHHKETFDDLAVRELAKSRATCFCLLEFGRCTRKECKSCEKARRYMNCYSQMNDYNKERIAGYIGDYYAAYSSNPTGWKSFRYLVKETVIYILAMLVYIAIPIVLCIRFEPF